MREFVFSSENLVRAENIIAKYPKGKHQSAILSLLDLAQRQVRGHITKDVITYIAKYLNMPAVKVQEIASFYSMLYLEEVGKYHVQVCTTTPCWLRGSETIVKACKDAIGIDVGQISTDKKFSLCEVECLGACVDAPLVQINDDYYENLTEDKIISIIKRLSQEN